MKLADAAVYLPAVAGGCFLLGGSPQLFALSCLAGAVSGVGISSGKRLRRLVPALMAAAFFLCAREFLQGLREALLCLARGEGAGEMAAALWAGLCLCLGLCRPAEQSRWTAALLLLPAYLAASSDTAVQGAFLSLYVFGLGLIFLPARLRKLRPEQGRRLALRLSLPLALMAAGVGVFLPLAGDGQALRGKLFSALTGIPGEYGIFSETAAVPLRHDAPGEGRREILEVTSRRGGVLYLRGRDYDTYTGTDWQSSARLEQFGGWGEVTDEVSVSVLGYETSLYLPYYPAEDTYLTDGRAPGSRMDYRVTVYARGTAMQPASLARYCRLPEDTWHWAYAYLAGATSAEEIRALVQQAGVYDRNTPAMPADTEDFALWFSREGRGYCTHFASLAVVLLRAAGIPARYVTGFLVEAKPGEPVTVTLAQAHAWAEYYDYSVGAWRILEATPGAAPEEERQAAKPRLLPLPAQALEKFCIFFPVFVISVVYLQGKGRLLARSIRLHRGNARRRAYYLHEEAQMLAALLGECLPDYLEAQMLAALYSRYPPREEELERFRVYCRQCVRRLRRKGVLVRFYHRFICGVY